ncbi:MAG: hypothetical protein AAF244_03930 [Pseudomonadota bacterium]
MSLDINKLKEKLLSTKSIVIGVSGFIVISIVLMIFSAMQPVKGNILYGMCSKFLEIQVPFPETIEQKEVELYRKAVRIMYTHTDGFGEYRLEMMECAFEQHPERGVQLADVLFNYVKPTTEKERIPGKGRLYRVKQEHIDLFNRSRSPAAILQDIDLSIPPGVLVRAF